MKMVTIDVKRIAVVFFMFYIFTVLVVSLIFEIKIFFPDGWILLQKEPLMDVHHNIIPFDSIQTYISNFHSYNLDVWLKNTIGNILLFIPFGVMYPIITFKFRKLIPTLTLMMIFSFKIEVLQYMTRLGVFDIDDVILQTFGGLLGFGLFRLLPKTN